MNKELIAIEVLNFGPRDSVPLKYDVPERELIVHNPNVCAVKANPEELRELGKEVAKKVNAAKGPTAILLPLEGLDKYEAFDGPWHAPETDRALFDVIQSNLRSDIQREEIMANINDPLFCRPGS